MSIQQEQGTFVRKWSHLSIMSAVKLLAFCYENPNLDLLFGLEGKRLQLTKHVFQGRTPIFASEFSPYRDKGGNNYHTAEYARDFALTSP